MAAVSIWVPRSPRDEFHHIPPLQKTFQDQQVGHNQASFKLQISPWVSEHRRFWGHFLILEVSIHMFFKHTDYCLCHVQSTDVPIRRILHFSYNVFN